MHYKLKKLWSVVRVINLYFWKTKIGPIFAVVLPLGFMLLYYAICSSLQAPELYKYEYFKIASPTFISMSVMPLSILTIPAMNIEFRSSIILRKIKTNSINAIEYSAISYVYYFVLNIIAVFLTIAMYSIFMAPHGDWFAYMDIGSLAYTSFCLILVSISVGTFLSIIIKNALNSQIIGFAIIIFSLLLSGQFINVFIVPRVDVLRNIAYVFPLSYPLSGMNVAMLYSNDNNIFEFNTQWVYMEFVYNRPPPMYPIYTGTQKLLFVVMPWVWFAVLQSASLAAFRWVVK